MNARLISASALLFLTVPIFGASREIQELQRDMALLQEQVRTLQRSHDEKLAALTVITQQTLDTVNKANTAVAVLENGIRQNLRDQAKSVVEPVAHVGSKVDQMSQDFLALREGIADLNRSLGKLQLQVVDLSNAVKTMQAPPPPPPGLSPAQGAAGGPPIPAETLFLNARRDKNGGKADLALQQFSDYVKYYGNTDAAPEAQYYIGEILLSQGDLDQALQEFDLVLERYPDNGKTADALYMKGMTLVKLGKRTQGAQEFRDLIKRFPTNDMADNACTQLKALGLKCAAPGAAAARRPAAAKKR